jgi:hypothetical protein
MPTRASAGGRDEAAPIQIRAQFLRERGACAPQGPSSGFAITLDDEAESKSECAPRRRASWQQKDVERALRAAREAGLTAYRVEIAPDGTISIVVGDPGEEKPMPAAA